MFITEQKKISTGWETETCQKLVRAFSAFAKNRSLSPPCPQASRLAFEPVDERTVQV